MVNFDADGQMTPEYELKLYIEYQKNKYGINTEDGRKQCAKWIQRKMKDLADTGRIIKYKRFVEYNEKNLTLTAMITRYPDEWTCVSG